MLKVTASMTAIALMAGCNTLSGLGKDVTGVAEWTKGAITERRSGGSEPSLPAYNPAPEYSSGVPALGSAF
ncbi:hypothetical protein GE300_14805 [Rhodobacteraceae bacterium 2CG4]|uniref:Small secreted protein n=1 Tax=Halovulum marinum TaxID=2662447 RepID=A0A6L5Z2R4_9RHOB|nr:hypothetical protein [Halovulum marinum]MSU90871.1 hypothetical protein [Halovulum marinum]